MSARRKAPADQDWPYCETCRSWHHPDNPTCFKRTQAEYPCGPTSHVWRGTDSAHMDAPTLASLNASCSCGALRLYHNRAGELRAIANVPPFNEVKRCIEAMLDRCVALGVSLAWPEFDQARALIRKE